MVLSIFILVVQLWAKLVLDLPLFASDLEYCTVWPVSSSLVGIELDQASQWAGPAAQTAQTIHEQGLIQFYLKILTILTLVLERLSSCIDSRKNR